MTKQPFWTEGHFWTTLVSGGVGVFLQLAGVFGWTVNATGLRMVETAAGAAATAVASAVYAYVHGTTHARTAAAKTPAPVAPRPTAAMPAPVPPLSEFHA